MSRKFTDNNEAVSTVVAALLLLVIIVTFIGTLNAYYIPSLGCQNEIKHMQDVKYNYLQFASAVGSGASNEKILIPLGSEPMIFGPSITSSGSLDVRSNNSFINISINGINRNDNDHNFLSIPVGTLKYKSANNFWLDQDLIFENGAVILSQSSIKDSIFRSDPYFYLDGNILNIHIFRIVGIDNSISGNGITTINVQVENQEETLYPDVETTNIEINSEYADAWQKYLQKLTSFPSLSNNGKNIQIKFNNKSVRVITTRLLVSLP